jgi:hypothetical protein
MVLATFSRVGTPGPEICSLPFSLRYGFDLFVLLNAMQDDLKFKTQNQSGDNGVYITHFPKPKILVHLLDLPWGSRNF